MFFEIDNPVIKNPDPLALQQLLHNHRTPEMVLSGQNPVPVNDPVSRDIVGLGVCGVHRPAYHPCRTLRTQELCDGSIGGDPPVWDQSGYFVNFFEKCFFPASHSSFLIPHSSFFPLPSSFTS